MRISTAVYAALFASLTMFIGLEARAQRHPRKQRSTAAPVVAPPAPPPASTAEPTPPEDGPGCLAVDTREHSRQLAGLLNLAIAGASTGTCSGLVVAREACAEAVATAADVEVVLRSCVGATVEGNSNAAFLAALDVAVPPEVALVRGFCGSLDAAGASPTTTAVTAVTAASSSSAEDALAAARRAATSCPRRQPGAR